MDRALDLAITFGSTAERLWIVLCIYLYYPTISILLAPGATDDVGTLQTYFLTRSHAEVLLRRIFHEVLGFDEELTGEADDMAVRLWVFGVVEETHLLGLSLGVIGDDEAYRVEDGRAT